VLQLDATADCDDKLIGNIGLILASTFLDSTSMEVDRLGLNFCYRIKKDM
jgi:hypothetical protein